MGVWSQKESMQFKALQHTKMMEANYVQDIQLSTTLSMIYQPPFDVKLTDSGKPETIEVMDTDSVGAALLKAKESNYKVEPCILNFASYKNPGGKFLEGSTAQEECLCHESYLYNVLEKFDKTYYAPHRTKGATDRALYHDEAIYTPNITFIRGTEEFKCSVITCAAPNYAAARKYYDVQATENAQKLLSRIQFVRKVAEIQGVDTIILGAFGCGVFGQDPSLVASYMNKTFSCSSIPHIVYAVPRGLNERNYRAFENRIAGTPL